ncbi:MAG: RHS repeat-associated core domain-containing protein, partial [Owenweeksia sp.]
YSITLRRKSIDTVYIEEEQHSTNFKAPVFAWMEYFPPDEAAGRTNVLQDHKIFIGDTDNGLTRHAHVDNLTTDQKAVKNMAQYSTGSVKSVTSFLYDVYGNITQLKGPENHQLHRLTFDFTYDNEMHQFVTAVSNSYGDQTCSVYDPATGKLWKSVDINGHVMGYDYDDYYRLVGVFAPDAFENNGRAATIAFAYYPTGIDSAAAYGGDYQSGVPVAITRHNVNQPEVIGDPDGCWNGVDGNPAEDCAAVCDLKSRPAISNPLQTATFMDGIQRVVQIKKEVPIANSSGTDNIKQKLVSGITEYDRQWRDSTLSLRTEEEISSSFPLAKLSIAKSAFYENKSTYDYASRLKKRYSIRESSSSFAETGMTYEWATLNGTEYFSIETNHEGQVIRNFTNARGQTVASTQSDAGTTYFTLDALNQLLKIEDPVGDTTTYKYDLMGRMLEEHHPDRGLSEFTYDKASNIRAIGTPEISPNTINMTYQYNRLTQKSYPGSNGVNKVIYTYGHRDDGKNGAGRVIRAVQGINFKVEYYSYDELGNRVSEKKSLKLPGQRLRHFTNSFDYDAWGRILSMTYPDGEELKYRYGNAGQLEIISSSLLSPDTFIVEKVLYDGFENIKKIKYGNGTETSFTYNDFSKRLYTQQLDVQGSSGVETLLDKTFTYQATGNVHSIANEASAITIGPVEFGGEYEHTYDYDNANRLTQSITDYGDPDQNGNQNYLELNMQYNAAGSITNKELINLNRQGSALLYHNYDNAYTYQSGKPHQLERTDPSGGLSHIEYLYNNEGSITHQTNYVGSQVFSEQEFLWDEEQRLNAVKNGNGVHHYLYDQNGERILKSTLRESGTAQNGQGTSSGTGLDPYIVYASPYFVATHYQEVVEASKHYYMNNQRVASALITYDYETQYDNSWPEPIGGGDPPEAILLNLQTALNEFGLVEGEDYSLEEMDNAISIEDYHSEDAYNLAAEDCNGDEQCLCEISMYWAAQNGVECPEYRIMYWYHPDYMGNNEAITNQAGQPYQYFLYSPFGENIVEDHSYLGSYSVPWQFSGKEYDQETGLHYFGARYYWGDGGFWWSVDPLSHYYPSQSPYNFVLGNPINLRDPDGRSSTCETCPDQERFDPYRNDPLVDYTYVPNEEGEGGEIHVSDHQQAGEVTVTAPEAGSEARSRTNRSGGGSITIWGTGANGVDPWNSYLSFQMFTMDMQDPFWSALLGWGQKETYNNTIPGSEWSDDVKDLTKSLTDIYQTADGMQEEEPVAPVPLDPKPTHRDSMYVRDKFIIRADGTKDTIPGGGDTIRFSTPLPYYQTIN